MVEISIEGDSVIESFSNFMEFTVMLSSPPTDAVTVNYRTLRGTALDRDLENRLTSTSNNGTVTFSPGQTSAQIFIEAESDSLDERDESLFIRLTNADGAVLADGANFLDAIGFIRDNDGVGLNIALAAASIQVTETAQATTPYEVLVELSQASSLPLTFDVTATD